MAHAERRRRPACSTHHASRITHHAARLSSNLSAVDRIQLPGTIPGNQLADLELIQGTLDTLVLKTLSWGPRHGYAVARWIKDTSDGTILVEDRALYVALHRLEERGWVESQWGLSENNRKAKYYDLTTLGRRQLSQKAANFATYAAAVFKILDTV